MAAGGEALGVQSPAELPGKRNQVEPALVAAWSAEEDAGTAEPLLAERGHQGTAGSAAACPFRAPKERT